MYLIAGLGNPGRQYKDTRHNIGFMAVDIFRERGAFASFKLKKKLLSEITEREGVVLAKPRAYMNDSGLAIRQLVDFYKVALQSIIVIHDDIELPLGEVKVSQNISAKGHNGVRSIIQHLGTQDFTRLRIGIGRGQISEVAPHEFVLQKFSREEEKIIHEAIKKACAELQYILENKL